MATKAPHRVGSYLKNVGKSFGYAVYDVFAEYNPTLKKIGEETVETTKEVYQSIKDWKDQSSDLNGEKLGIKGSVKAIFNNMKDDLASGNWYNKARQDSLSDSMMSSMFGGDDFDFSFDDDWGDDFDSDKEDGWGEDDTAKAVVSENQKSTKEIITNMDQVGYSVASTVNKGTATSANYVAEVSMANTQAIINMNRQGFSTVATALAGVNSNINNFAKIAEPLTIHMQNASQFYANTSETLKKMSDNLEQLVKNTTKAKPGANRYQMKNTFSGLLDDDMLSPKAYLDMVKENFKNDKDLIDMAKNIIKGIDPRKMSPGVFVTQWIVKGMIPKMFKDTMQEFNETLKYSMTDMLLKGRQRVNNVPGIPGMILGFLSDYIFPRDQIKLRPNSGAYEKGPVSWDGMSRRAVMNVIPHLLSMIHTDLSGEPFLVYDYNAGKFVTKTSIEGIANKRIKDTAKDIGRDFRKDIEDTARGSKRFTDKEIENIVKSVDAFFEYHLKNGTLDAISMTSFMKTSYYTKLKQQGLNEHAIGLIQDMITRYRSEGNFKGLNNIRRITTETAKARDRLSQENYDRESSGSDTIIALEELSDTLNGSKEAVKKAASGGTTIATLYLPDKFGNTHMDYMRGIYQYSQAIYTLISNIGIGGRRKGKRGGTIVFEKGKVTVPEQLNITEIIGGPETTATSRQDEKLRGVAELKDPEVEQRKGAREQLDAISQKVKDYFGINGVNFKSVYNAPFVAVSNLLNKISLSLTDLVWGKDGDPDSGLFGIFKQKAADAFDSFKEKFADGFKDKFGEMFDKIFGKKGEDGKRQGGFFSDLYNETKLGLGSAWNFTKGAFQEAWYGKDYKNILKRQEAAKRRKMRIMEQLENARANDVNVNAIQYAAGSGSGLLNLRRYAGGASEAVQYVKDGDIWKVISADGTETIVTDKALAKSLNRQQKKREVRHGKVIRLENQLRNVRSETNRYVTETSEASGNKYGVPGSARGMITKGVKAIWGGIKNWAKGLIPEDADKEKQKLKELMDENIKKELSEGKGKIAAGAIIGGGISLLTGSVFGPLFGSAIGAGVGILVSSKTVREKLFGKEWTDENKQHHEVKGLLGGPNSGISKLITQYIPKGAKGAIVGAVPGLLLGGQFGMFGGMVIGAGINILSSSDEFKKKMFGDGKDDKGMFGAFKEKVLDKIEELFKNTGNAIFGWAKKLGNDIKKKINSFILERLAKPLKEKTKERGKKFLSGLIKAPFLPLKGLYNIGTGILSGVNEHRFRKNVRKGYRVFDKKLGRNLDSADIIASDRVNWRDPRTNGAGKMYQMLANAESEEEIDEILNALDAAQNGKRYAKDNDNVIKAMRNGMSNFGYTGNMNQLEQVVRSGNEKKLDAYIKDMGFSTEQAKFIKQQAKKINTNLNTDKKATELLNNARMNGWNIRHLNLPGFRDIAADDKLRIRNSAAEKELEKAKDAEKKLQENVQDVAEDVSVIKEGIVTSLTGNKKQKQQFAKAHGAKETVNQAGQEARENVDLFAGKEGEISEIQGMIRAKDPANGSQQGHTFHQDMFGQLEMKFDEDNNLIPDDSSSINKEYNENKKSFFDSIKKIPVIGDGINGIRGLFGKLKDKLFGEDKEKKSLFDKIAEFFSGEGGLISKFKKFFGKGGGFSKMLTTVGNILGIAGIATAIGALSGKFDNFTSVFGGHGDDKNIQNASQGHTEIYVEDADGNLHEVATDENGNPIKTADGYQTLDGQFVLGTLVYQQTANASEKIWYRHAMNVARGGDTILGRSGRRLGSVIKGNSREGSLRNKLGTKIMDKFDDLASKRRKWQYGMMDKFGEKTGINNIFKKGGAFAEEEGGQLAFKFDKNGNIMTGKISREATGEAAEQAAESAVKKTMNEFVEESGGQLALDLGGTATSKAATEATIEAAQDAATGKLMKASWADDFTEALVKTFTRVKKMFGWRMGKEMADSLPNIARSIAPTLAKKASSAMAKSVWKVGKDAIKAIPVVGWILAAVDAAWSFQEGWNRAARELQVNEATTGEKALSGLVEAALALLGVIPGLGIITGIISIFKPLLTQLISKALQSLGFLQDLKKRQEESQAEYEADQQAAAEAYTGEGEYQWQSYDEWNAQKHDNYTWGERIGNEMKAEAARRKKAFETVTTSLKENGVKGTLELMQTGWKNMVIDYKAKMDKMKEYVANGDVKGLQEDQFGIDKLDPENPTYNYQKTAVAVAKFVNTPAAVLKGIGNKVKEITDKFTSKIKISDDIVQKERQRGEDLMASGKGSLKAYFDMSDYNDPENPIGGFQKVAILSQRLAGAGAFMTKMIGLKIKDKVDEMKAKIQATGDSLKQIHEESIGYMKTGDIGALCSAPFAKNDDPDNPIGPLQRVLSFGEMALLMIPTGVSWVGHKIKERVEETAQKIRSTVSPIQNNIMTMNEMANSGDYQGLADYDPGTEDDEGNPASGMQKAILGAYRLYSIPKAFFVSVGGKIKSEWDKFIDPVREDKAKFEKAIDELKAAAVAGDGDKLTAVKFEPKTGFGGLMSVGFGITKTIFTIAGFVSGLANKVKGLWGNSEAINEGAEQVATAADNKVNSWYENIYNFFANSSIGKSTAVSQAVASDPDAKRVYDAEHGEGAYDAMMAAAGGSSGFVSQLDSRYARMNMGGYSFAEKGCGPAVASMVSGMPVSSAVAASSRYMTNRGVTADYFQDVLGAQGIGTATLTNKGDILRSLAGSGNVILLGRDPSNTSKARSPFGPNSHYVVATGVDRNGNIIVNDPENNHPVAYSPSILDSAQVGIAAGAGTNLRLLAGGRAVAGTDATGTGKTGKSDFYNYLQSKVTSDDVVHVGGRNVPEQVWDYFYGQGYPPHAIAGILGNLKAESGLFPQRVQGDFSNGYQESIAYTNQVDSGAVSRDDFANHGPHGGGYGLPQFTWHTYKESLYDNAKSKGVSIGDTQTQLEEMDKWAGTALSHIKSAQSAEQASDIWLDEYEKPADREGTRPTRRGFANSILAMWDGSKFHYTDALVSPSYSGSVSGSVAGTVGTAGAVGATGATAGAAGEAGTSGESGTGGESTYKGGIGGVLGAITSAFGKIGEFFSGTLNKNNGESGSTGTSGTAGTAGTAGATAGVSAATGGYLDNALASVQFPNGGGPADMMEAIEGKIGYSQTTRNPDAGAADCSSTVQWAVKKAGGPDIGGNTGAQYNNANLTPLWHNGGQYATEISQNAERNDIMFFARPGGSSDKGAALDHVGHVGVYLGNNQYIDHGSGMGPKKKTFKGADTKLIKIARVNGLPTVGDGPKTGGINYATDPKFTAQNNYGTAKTSNPYGPGSGSGLLTYDQLAAVAGGSSGLLLTARPGDKLYGSRPSSSKPFVLAGGGPTVGISATGELRDETPVVGNKSQIGVSNGQMSELYQQVAKIAENTDMISSIYEVLIKIAQGDIRGAMASAQAALANHASAQEGTGPSNGNEGISESFRSLVGSLAAIAGGKG